MKFSFKYFFSECDQILNLLQIWSHLLMKSLMENFIFCAALLSCIWITISTNRIVDKKTSENKNSQKVTVYSVQLMKTKTSITQ